MDAFNDLMDEYVKLRKELNDAEDRAKKLEEDRRVLEDGLVKMMISRNIKSQKTTDGVTLTHKVMPVFYVANKENFIADMKKTEYAVLIKEDVNWQTLQSTMKQLQEGGDPLFDKFMENVTKQDKNTISLRGVK